MSLYSIGHSQFGGLLSGTLEGLKTKLEDYRASNAKRDAQTSFSDAYEYEANKIMRREDARRIEDLEREIGVRERNPVENANVERRYGMWQRGESLLWGSKK